MFYKTLLNISNLESDKKLLLVESSIGSFGSPKRPTPSEKIRFPNLALGSIKSFSKVLIKMKVSSVEH